MPNNSQHATLTKLQYEVIIEGEKAREAAIMEPMDWDIKFYTDGSHSLGISGSGYVLLQRDHSMASFTPLGTYATVYQAEVNAI